VEETKFSVLCTIDYSRGSVLPHYNDGIMKSCLFHTFT